jgi:hypothetical protein
LHIRYALFIGWLGVMAVVLLAPAGGVSADPAALSRVAWLQQALSSVVIWAAKDGSLWHVVWFLVLGALTAVLSTPPPSRRERYRQSAGSGVCRRGVGSWVFVQTPAEFIATINRA